METILVCLHGWGGSKESFTELQNALEGSRVRVLTPDLPGFGAEPEPKEPWTVDDYASWTAGWIARELPKNGSSPAVSLLGHSHGGRIAIMLAARQAANPHSLAFRIDRLYLCASAGIRHPRHCKRIFGLTLAKTGKFLLSVPGMKALQPFAKKVLYRLVRVHDYEKASPVMRQTLVKVSAQDLRLLLPTVAVPTAIFWGDDDGMTPVSDGVLMHRTIPGSTLRRFPGVRHAVHRDRAKDIAAAIEGTNRS